MPAAKQQDGSWKIRRKQQGNRANHEMGTAVLSFHHYEN
jgi:hypothetical protein